MAASAAAIAAQLVPIGVTVTEALIKGTLFAQQVQSANLINRTQWIAMWDMADTQFLTGYDAVMGVTPTQPTAPVAAAPVATPAATPTAAPVAQTVAPAVSTSTAPAVA